MVIIVEEGECVEGGQAHGFGKWWAIEFRRLVGGTVTVEMRGFGCGMLVDFEVRWKFGYHSERRWMWWSGSGV